jgi:hypothetical protein
MKAYDIEWILDLGHDVAKIELPFSVKQGFESQEEFAARAARDLGIIKMFVVKFSVKKYRNSKVAAESIVDQLKLHVTRTAAFARAFLNNVEKSIADPVLEILYEECTGNLPAQFKNGGLDPSSESPVIKIQRQLPFNSIGQTAKIKPDKKIDNRTWSKPLVLAVPNPMGFTV